jgi:hypothetical protein
MLRRNSLSRVSAPGLARTSPQPVSPRTPSKSLSAKGACPAACVHHSAQLLPLALSDSLYAASCACRGCEV